MNFIKKWLKKLEEANKSSFGSEPLDCCTVGREKKTNKSMRMTQNKK